MSSRTLPVIPREKRADIYIFFVLLGCRKLVLPPRTILIRIYPSVGAKLSWRAFSNRKLILYQRRGAVRCRRARVQVCRGVCARGNWPTSVSLRARRRCAPRTDTTGGGGCRLVHAPSRAFSRVGMNPRTAVAYTTIGGTRSLGVARHCYPLDRIGRVEKIVDRRRGPRHSDRGRLANSARFGRKGAEVGKGERGSTFWTRDGALIGLASYETR